MFHASTILPAFLPFLKMWFPRRLRKRPLGSTNHKLIFVAFSACWRLLSAVILELEFNSAQGVQVGEDLA